MTEFTDPIFAIGDLGQLESSSGGAIILPDQTNGPSGPSMFFGGTGAFDPRYTFLKDLVTGFAGRVPGFLDNFTSNLISAIPIAHATANIAALQSVASGTAMTLVTAPAQGISVNIPIIPFTGTLNSLGTATTATSAPIVMDYGFDWMAIQSGSSIATVTDSTIYRVGMPLCIAGTSASTTLLTNVVSIASATTIQIGPSPNVPNVTLAQTPVGTGNAWGPSEFASSNQNPFTTANNSPYPVPNAALPYIAMGPGLFLDPRQSVSRAIALTASASTASVATFTVAGWDLYWQPMTETVGPFTASSSVLTTYTKKAFKALASVTPLFNDGTHSWSSGTSDVIGIPMLQTRAEHMTVWWNGLQMVSTTGFTAADFTSPASATTGDVRGTVQLSTIGASANGFGAATSGTVSSGSLAVTGARLVLYSSLPTWNQLNATLTNPQWQMGRTQA